MNQEPIKVKDGSQPIKIILLIFFGSMVLLLLWDIRSLLQEIVLLLKVSII